MERTQLEHEGGYTYEEIFEQYVQKYYFLKDVYSRDYLQLLGEEGTFEGFLQFREWVHQNMGSSAILAIKEKHADRMSELLQVTLEEFKESQKNVKLRLPTLEEATQYRGMFDEYDPVWSDDGFSIIHRR